MAQVFNQASLYGGSMKAADIELVKYSSTGDIQSAMLVQNMQIGYQQGIQRIYDLTNTAYTFFVAGKPAGTFSLAHILGPKGMVNAFVTDYGNVCSPKSFTVQINGNEANGCVSTSGQINVNQAVITGLGISVDSGSFLITEAINGEFIGLDIS